MGFLDNSGDIILDAVLTDTGRHRLAKGDGSFKVAKFAFGDDEINYNSYNKDHASGSAYYDLDILQTPVLEAFTNNTSLMRSKLITISRTNLLYLPVLKLNAPDLGNTKQHTSGTFIITVDEATEKPFASDGVYTANSGILKGFNVGGAGTGGEEHIRVDQGLDTTAISPATGIDDDLNENQYIIEMDDRLGKLYSAGGAAQPVSFIDDDNIASYYLSLGDVVMANANQDEDDATEVIDGPRGTTLKFKIRASTDLRTSTYLFEQLGSTSGLGVGSEARPLYHIDTTIRITGATTGYRIDVPIRYVKNR